MVTCLQSVGHSMATVWLALMVAFAGPAFAHSYALQPDFPVSSLPFRVLVHGSLDNQTVVSHGEPVLDGTTLKLILWTEAAGLGPDEPPIPYFQSVVVESLAEGHYGLEVFTRSLEDGEERLISSGGPSEIIVDSAYELTVPQVASTVSETAPVVFSGVAYCPTVEALDGPMFRGQKILYTFQPTCVTTPPIRAPFEFEIEVPTAGLATGTYDLEISSFGDALLVQQTLRVVDDPVMLHDRFEIRLDFYDPAVDDRVAQRALAGRLPSADSALFYFFDPSNLEFMVKVIDGCSFNGYFWVFAAGATDLEYILEVTDNATTNRWFDQHAGGRPAPAVTDTMALPCP